MSQKIKEIAESFSENCFCPKKTPWIHFLLKIVAQEVLDIAYEETGDLEKDAINIAYLEKKLKHAKESMNDNQMYYARTYMAIILAKHTGDEWGENCNVTDEKMKEYIEEVFDAVAGIHINDKPAIEPKP